MVKVALPPKADELPPAGLPPKKNRFKNWRSAASTLAVLLLAPLMALFIAAFVIQSYQVDGQSMEDTLQHNDRLIVDKWPRTLARVTNNDYVPKRGDIIIFNQPGLGTADNPKQLIKRVIGLPGERVVVNSGKVTVYNSMHPKGYNPDTFGTYQLGSTDTSGSIDVELTDEEIFVLGDNRSNSEDSRHLGPVELDQIIGKLAFRVVPLSKAQRF